MYRWKRAALAPLMAVPVILAACSSTSTGSVTSSGASKTYTVGVLTDLTGPGASVNATTPTGVKAGTIYAKEHGGYTIKYVIGDTATNPSEALPAAQKLVEQDHVFAVVAISALTFGAATYLTQNDIPVVGVAEDGPEWITSKNMFSSIGPLNTKLVATTQGDFFKMKGVTNLGSLGYSISPSSAEAAEGAAVSAKHAGLKAGYVNASFPFGSTNVAPVALAMKSAGVDGMTADVDPNTEFSLITTLKQDGVNLKAVLLPTGYGGDIYSGGPGAIQDAQGVYFLSSFEPVEMHTAATEQMMTDMKQAGVTTDPTYAEYAAYTSMALLTEGLQGAGSHPTQASLIKSLGDIKAFTAAGLFGDHSLNMSQRTGVGEGVDNCGWITQLEGTSFKLVAGADPICGSIIPGKTVSPPS